MTSAGQRLGKLWPRPKNLGQREILIKQLRLSAITHSVWVCHLWLDMPTCVSVDCPLGIIDWRKSMQNAQPVATLLLVTRYIECSEGLQVIKTVHLTGGNWQKLKRVFLTCPCHKMYRDEAVGLKSGKNTWKITIFVEMWNLGQNRENLIFCQ